MWQHKIAGDHQSCFQNLGNYHRLPKPNVRKIHPRGRTLPQEMFKVYFQRHWRVLSMTSKEPLVGRKLSTGLATFVPHRWPTQLCHPPNHPVPAFTTHYWSNVTKRCMETLLCLLFLTRSHSCNLTQSLSRKISFQMVCAFHRGRDASPLAHFPTQPAALWLAPAPLLQVIQQSQQGRACASTPVHAVQKHRKMWHVGSQGWM